MRYQVVVGNVGSVLDTDDGVLAHKTFSEWVEISKRGEGRAAGEDVHVLDHVAQDILLEYECHGIEGAV